MGNGSDYDSRRNRNVCDGLTHGALTKLRNELSAEYSSSTGERAINTKGKALSAIQRVPAESANDHTMF